MKEFLASLASWGPTGLFLAAMLDGAGVPVPSGVDVLIVFLTTQLPQQVYWLAAVAVLGSVAGNLFLFALAHRGGQMFLAKRTKSKRSHRTAFFLATVRRSPSFIGGSTRTRWAV